MDDILVRESLIGLLLLQLQLMDIKRVYNKLMIKKRLKILIIDDHSLVIKGLKMTLLELNKVGFDLVFDTAESYEFGLEKVKKENLYDVIFIDILLKSSIDGEIHSGENIGVKINSLVPKPKLVVLTSLNDCFRIRNILNTLQPDGFLIKSDITNNELINAFKKVIENPPFYSNSIISILNAEKNHGHFISDLDKNILYHISIGIQTKDLPKYIPLSISGIEKRKRHLKNYFNIDKKGDTTLIHEAKLNKII